MSHETEPQNYRRWLWAIVLAGAILRFFPLWFGLPYPHARPDEATTIGRAAGMLAGDLNPHFFNWPSLTFYIVGALFQVASWIRIIVGLDPDLTTTQYWLIGRGAVAVAGTLTVAMLFRLARRMAGVETGLIAAAFLAVAVLHVRDSHFATTDIIMTLLVVTSLTMLLRAVDFRLRLGTEGGRSTRRFIAAGLAAGLATSTKYSAAAVIASMAAAQLIVFTRPADRPWSWRAWMPSVAFIVALVAGFIYGTPYAMLDYRTFAADVSFEFSHLSGGVAVDLGRGWSYHLTRSLPYGAGLGIFVAAVIGVVPFVRHYRRHALILGAFAAGLYASLGSGQTVFFRYVMPLIPFVCLSAAVAVHHVATSAARRWRSGSTIVLVALLLLTAGPALANSVWLDVLLARTDSRVLAARWLIPRLQPHESLYDSGGDYARLDLPEDAVQHWTYDPRGNDFGDPAGRVADWLVLHESPLTTYADPLPALRQLARDKYEHVYTVRATKVGSHSAIYDMQDAFFLPIAGFRGVERPGPTVLIYRRRPTTQFP